MRTAAARDEAAEVGGTGGGVVVDVPSFVHNIDLRLSGSRDIDEGYFNFDARSRFSINYAVIYYPHGGVPTPDTDGARQVITVRNYMPGHAGTSVQLGFHHRLTDAVVALAENVTDLGFIPPPLASPYELASAFLEFCIANEMAAPRASAEASAREIAALRKALRHEHTASPTSSEQAAPGA